MALAYANDASAFLKQNNKSKAIELYKTALSHYPALPGFKTILRLFFETKNYEEMENYAQWCSRQYPNANFQYYYLSLSHIIKKDYKTAIPYLLKLNNTMAVYKFYNLALSYFYLNDYKKSLFYWKKYHEVNPKDLNAKKNIKNLENYFQKSNSKK
jgi:tetratricopeptide (TPR) repeat protein